MTLPDVVITHALRTPIGKFLGTLKPLSAVQLGTAVVKEIVDRAKLAPDEVGELLFGQGRQLGSGPNPARQVTIRAGIADSCVATTINKACGSSLKAIWYAYQAVALGEQNIIVAGGMESMTNIPFLLPDMRFGYRLGHNKVLDGTYRDGFDCPLAEVPMGMTAEYLADKYAISRKEQDEYALSSFKKWEKAEEAGRFDDERMSIEVPGRKGQVTVMDWDEHGRKGMTYDKLAKLPTVFRKEGGTVHAGNASGITDAAAAVIVTTREEAERRGWPILARIGSAATAGVDPRFMGIGPVPAIRKLNEKLGTKIDDFDLIELNEAFAAQMLACDREIPLDRNKLNVNGGAIALGHPIGCTGARIVATLLHEMNRRDVKTGMASLCMSGGMGMAMSFHR